MKKRSTCLAGKVFVLSLTVLIAPSCRPKPSSLRITPAKVTLYGPGRTQSLKYEITDKKGNPLPGLTAEWVADKPKVATIDPSGIVRSVTPGRAIMTATFQNLTSSAVVEVMDVSSLNVSPSRMTLVGPAGTQMKVLAEIKDGKGNLSPLKPKWVSVDPKVATVDGEGVVTSGAEGRTNIIASLGNDVSSACDVKVLHRAIATFELTPLTLIMKAGETQRITATIRDSTGVLIEDAALAWTSSDPRTATVSNGTVTGVGRGTARISVATSTQTLTADVLVN
ncbi:MAG TPA: Ig-like domain-containing protein [Thermoanaerobaculia bacterium]|nr:Ig-like domain-containing protein [Thermoanaerobaculia bacterium]